MEISRRVANPGSGFAESVSTSGTGRTIHVSGHVGLDADGGIVAGGVAAEARTALMGIDQALRNAGGTLADVVRITAFMTNLDDYAEYAKVRTEIFGEHLPASSTVGVASLLLGAAIEIEAVAVTCA